MDPQPHKFNPAKDRMVTWGDPVHTSKQDTVHTELLSSIEQEIAQARLLGGSDIGALTVLAVKVLSLRSALSHEGYYRTKEKQISPRKRPEEGSL